MSHFVGYPRISPFPVMCFYSAVRVVSWVGSMRRRLIGQFEDASCRDCLRRAPHRRDPIRRCAQTRACWDAWVFYQSSPSCCGAVSGASVPFGMRCRELAHYSSPRRSFSRCFDFLLSYLISVSDVDLAISLRINRVYFIWLNM